MMTVVVYMIYKKDYRHWHNSMFKVQILLLLRYDGPTLTSIHDYWKNYSSDYMGLCQQSDVSVVLEKTLESPLGSKEIKPVISKGNQPWIFIFLKSKWNLASSLWKMCNNFLSFTWWIIKFLQLTCKFTFLTQYPLESSWISVIHNYLWLHKQSRYFRSTLLGHIVSSQ